MPHGFDFGHQPAVAVAPPLVGHEVPQRIEHHVRRIGVEGLHHVRVAAHDKVGAVPAQELCQVPLHGILAPLVFVAPVTMMGIQRNTMLGELRREVEQFPEEDRRRRVLRKIDSYMNDKENHELFEKYFNTIHDGFYTRLLQRHPGLTPNEMRICAYIKLNLNTKEIAAYMNISPSSVEIARHRLRKKMELASEVNLQHYISAI